MGCCVSRILGVCVAVTCFVSFANAKSSDKSCPDFSGIYTCEKVKTDKNEKTVLNTIYVTQYQLDNAEKTMIVEQTELQTDKESELPIGLVLDEQFYPESNDEYFAISRRSTCKKNQLVTERVINVKDQEGMTTVYPSIKSTMICELNRKKNMECNFVMNRMHISGAQQQEAYTQTCLRVQE
jgi:hypothetical protein